MSVAMLESTTSNLQSRSACPWTHSYNYDPNRQPQYLIQAHCQFITLPGTAKQCEHVYTFVPVKKTDTATGTVSDQWLKLKVGCTLASPPVVNQPPITTN
jgi:Interleukin-17